MKKHIYLLFFLGLTLLSTSNTIFSINIIEFIEYILFVNRPDKYGQTKLSNACCMQKLQDIKKLLKHKYIDINKTDKIGRTPLHEVCIMGYQDIFTELLKCKNIDINKTDNNNDSPIYLACLNNNTDIANLLLEHGAILDQKTLAIIYDKQKN